MKQVNKTQIYTRPEIELQSIAAERGFFLSDEVTGYPGENPDFNDFGEF